MTTDDLSTRRSALNHFLGMSGVDCIKQSNKKFSSLQAPSQNSHITKASEAVAAVLDVIAPGDAGALWKATKKSKIVDKIFEVGELDDSEKV